MIKCLGLTYGDVVGLCIFLFYSCYWIMLNGCCSGLRYLRSYDQFVTKQAYFDWWFLGDVDVFVLVVEDVWIYIDC